MTAQPVPSATTALLAYRSAVQDERDYAIQMLAEHGAEMLLDPDFTELLIPHFDGTHPGARVTDQNLNVALTKALQDRLPGRGVVLGSALTPRGYKELRVDFRRGARNFSSDDKAFLWEALTNLSVGAGNGSLPVTVRGWNSAWSVSPLSRQWVDEAFGN